MLSDCVVAVVIRRGAVGTDDPGCLSLPRGGQLGHCKIPQEWTSHAPTILLPRRIVSCS